MPLASAISIFVVQTLWSTLRTTQQAEATVAVTAVATAAPIRGAFGSHQKVAGHCIVFGLTELAFSPLLPIEQHCQEAILQTQSKEMICANL